MDALVGGPPVGRTSRSFLVQAGDRIRAGSDAVEFPAFPSEATGASRLSTLLRSARTVILTDTAREQDPRFDPARGPLNLTPKHNFPIIHSSLRWGARVVKGGRL